MRTHVCTVAIQVAKLPIPDGAAPEVNWCGEEYSVQTLLAAEKLV